MAGRIRNRMELRKQADLAEQPEAAGLAAAMASTGKPARVKAPAKARKAPAKKPRAKKAPPRLYALWSIRDNTFRQVATFAYNERGAADEKLADLRARNKGPYYMQIVKEEKDAPEPAAATPAPPTYPTVGETSATSESR